MLHKTKQILQYWMNAHQQALLTLTLPSPSYDHVATITQLLSMVNNLPTVMSCNHLAVIIQLRPCDGSATSFRYYPSNCTASYKYNKLHLCTQRDSVWPLDLVPVSYSPASALKILIWPRDLDCFLDCLFSAYSNPIYHYSLPFPPHFLLNFKNCFIRGGGGGAAGRFGKVVSASTLTADHIMIARFASTTDCIQYHVGLQMRWQKSQLAELPWKMDAFGSFVTNNES